MIVICGAPWNSKVTTRLRITATLPDGTPYRNEGIQFMRLQFGTIVEDRVFEDTVILGRALAKIASTV